jgi:Cu/Ag efflux pump CusA
LEKIVLMEKDGTPVCLKDVARIELGGRNVATVFEGRNRAQAEAHRVRRAAHHYPAAAPARK